VLDSLFCFKTGNRFWYWIGRNIGTEINFVLTMLQNRRGPDLPAANAVTKQKELVRDGDV